MDLKYVTLHENEEFLTLNVLLKICGIISTGGMAKAYLAENTVYVNDEVENRRGRKLYENDKIKVENQVYIIKKP